MCDAYDLEGYSVFALMITVKDNAPELWGIYSNAMACCEAGEKYCQTFLDIGIDATYYCKSYDVMGE